MAIFTGPNVKRYNCTKVPTAHALQDKFKHFDNVHAPLQPDTGKPMAIRTLVVCRDDKRTM